MGVIAHGTRIRALRFGVFIIRAPDFWKLSYLHTCKAPVEANLAIFLNRVPLPATPDSTVPEGPGTKLLRT